MKRHSTSLFIREMQKKTTIRQYFTPSRITIDIIQKTITSVSKDKKKLEPWLVWLNGLSTGLQTKKSPIRFPIRAHALVAGQIPVGGS